MASVQARVPTRAAQFDLGEVDLRSQFGSLKRSLHWKLFGQPGLAEKIFVALLADGHLLLSGASERSKLGIYHALAEAFAGDAQLFRLKPNTTTSELTGFDHDHPEQEDRQLWKGAVFRHFLFLDEIDCAAPLVQMVLLEALATGRVTVGLESHALAQPFFVVGVPAAATSPECTISRAVQDSFALMVRIEEPAADVSQGRVELLRGWQEPEPADGIASLSAELLEWVRRDVAEMKLVPSLERYVERLVLATRHPGRFGKPLDARVEAGANLETVDVLLRSARACAWLRGHRFVCAADVQQVLGDVLRHRIQLTHAAREEGVDSDVFLRELIHCVPFL